MSTSVGPIGSHAVSAMALNLNPLASDGLIFLQPGGIPIGPLFETIRYALARVERPSPAALVEAGG